MSGKGRGNLLEIIKKEASLSESLHASEDSGLVSESSEPNKGNYKINEDLSTALSKVNFAVGRGRSQLLAAYNKQLSVRNIEKTSLDINRVSSEHVDSKESVASTSNKQAFEIFNPINKYGSKGVPVQLATNYIKLTSDSTKSIYVYEVRFCPNVDSKELRLKYLNEHRDFLGKTKTFDGVLLFLPKKFDKDIITLFSKGIHNSSNIEIRIHYKKKESFKNCITFYNLLFNRIMKILNYVRFERKHFDPTAPKVIPSAKLEVWPGYVTAIDEYDGGLMLCCDVSHRILCQKTVLELLVEIQQYNLKKFQENAKKAIVGSVVITRYNNKTYRVDDICFDQNPQSTFETRSGSISYIEYYRKQHNIEIQDIQQPLLLSIMKVRKPDNEQTEDLVFSLIPEICHLTGLRDEIRSDFRIMREIGAFTRVTPNQRQHALEKFYNNINNSQQAKELLHSWGLSLDQACENMVGRKFEEEQIIFANKSFLAGKNSEFSAIAVNNDLLEVVPLINWTVLHTKMNADIAKSFINNMNKCTRAIGMRVMTPKIVVIDNDRVESYVLALRSNIDKKLQIIVCICPTNRDDIYNAIKKICCVEMPVPSQVINARTLSNEIKNRSIVQKIALQMNCKMGGSLWKVKIPFNNVMICGIDSYHDTTHRGNSVSAFVASLNNSYTKWFSKAVIQTRKEEIINGLCSSFCAALKAYEKLNGCLPGNVIIYRDGVGDGQLNLCVNYEIPQFEAASHGKIKITFIVVQKRINTRFFCVNEGRRENPLPGTIVDNHITRNKMYDFFLVSQSIRLGTVSPAHYIVLRDDSNWGPDIIQRLSYKLCFLYYNWAGTIRVPACCQYAHKLAYLVGQSIQRNTSEELSTKLYYL